MNYECPYSPANQKMWLRALHTILSGPEKWICRQVNIYTEDAGRLDMMMLNETILSQQDGHSHLCLIHVHFQTCQNKTEIEIFVDY